MSEFNVLVSGNATPIVKGGTISKEESSGTDSAAMEFAAIFSGWMAQVIGQGQNSGFQSSDPAGKEANSGQTALLGSVGTLGFLRTTLLSPAIQGVLTQDGQNEEFLGTGTMLGKPQGEIAPQTELDKYKNIINTLLKEMSGEIRDVTPSQGETKPFFSRQDLQQAAAQLMSFVESGETQVNNLTPDKSLSLAGQIESQVYNPVQTNPPQAIEGGVSLQQDSQSPAADKTGAQENVIPKNSVYSSGFNQSKDIIHKNLNNVNFDLSASTTTSITEYTPKNINLDLNTDVGLSKTEISSLNVSEPISFEVNDGAKSGSKITVQTTDPSLKLPLELNGTDKNALKSTILESNSKTTLVSNLEQVHSILKVLKTFQDKGVTLPEAISRLLNDESLPSKGEGELEVQLGNKEQLAQEIHPAETLKQEGSSKQVQAQSIGVQRIPQAINQVNLYSATSEQAKAQTQVQTVSGNLISIDPSAVQDKQQKFNELESLSGKAEKEGILSEDNDSRLMALGVTQSVAKVDAPIPSKVDSPVWVQVAQEIQQNVPTARTPLRELDIQLHPAELGHIRIALTWDNGQVHLRMAASEAGTGQTLQATLPDLRQSLTGMGIQCGMMQMGFGDHRQNPQQGQQRESMTRLKDERNNEISNTLLPLELETSLQRNYSGSSSDNYRINVTA